MSENKSDDKNALINKHIRIYKTIINQLNDLKNDYEAFSKELDNILANLGESEKDSIDRIHIESIQQRAEGSDTGISNTLIAYHTNILFAKREGELPAIIPPNESEDYIKKIISKYVDKLNKYKEELDKILKEREQRQTSELITQDTLTMQVTDQKLKKENEQPAKTKEEKETKHIHKP